MGHSGGTFLRVTFVEHSCGHSCGSLLWDTFAEHFCGTLQHLICLQSWFHHQKPISCYSNSLGYQLLLTIFHCHVTLPVFPLFDVVAAHVVDVDVDIANTIVCSAFVIANALDLFHFVFAFQSNNQPKIKSAMCSFALWECPTTYFDWPCY